MIQQQMTDICPLCGSLQIKYNQYIKLWKCAGCTESFKNPLKRSLPFRGDRCTDMYPAGRLISKYPQPPLPKKQMKKGGQCTKIPQSTRDKYQSILIFEEDPDPWRLYDYV